MNGQMNEGRDGKMEGWTDVWMKEYLYILNDLFAYGWAMDGWTGRRKHAQIILTVKGNFLL